MFIEKISRAKANEMLILELSNGEKICLSEYIVIKKGYIKGSEITKSELSELRLLAEGENAFKKALEILSKRPYSKKEIIKKLTEKGFLAENAENAVKKLEQNGIINDESYAAMLVNNYAKKGYGEKRISEELKKRGIEKETTEDLITKLDEKELEATIYSLITKKLKGEFPKTPNEKAKIVSFLLRRGFLYENIKLALYKYKIELEE